MRTLITKTSSPKSFEELKLNIYLALQGNAEFESAYGRKKTPFDLGQAENHVNLMSILNAFKENNEQGNYYVGYAGRNCPDLKKRLAYCFTLVENFNAYEETKRKKTLSDTEKTSELKIKLIDELNKYITLRTKKVSNNYVFISVSFFKNAKLTEGKVSDALALIKIISSSTDIKNIKAAILETVSENNATEKYNPFKDKYGVSLKACLSILDAYGVTAEPQTLP